MGKLEFLLSLNIYIKLNFVLTISQDPEKKNAITSTGKSKNEKQLFQNICKKQRKKFRTYKTHKYFTQTVPV